MTTKIRRLLTLRRCHTCTTALTICHTQRTTTGRTCCLFCAHPVTEGMEK